jgi:hypothetical protein
MTTLPDDQGLAPYFYPLLSTGTQLDELNPKHYTEQDGTLVLVPGGLGRFTLICGQACVGKTLLATNLIVRAMERMPGSDLIVKTTDCEAEDVDRISKYSSLYLDDPDRRREHLLDLESRISTFGIDDDDPGFDAFVTWLRNKADDKIARAEELTIDTPFINLYNGEHHRMLVPTFLLIDSWDGLNVTIPEGCLTPHLEYGAIMNCLLMDIVRICNEANIYLVITKHLNRKMNISTGKFGAVEDHPTGRIAFLSSVTIRVDSFTTGLYGDHHTQHISLARCQWASSGQTAILKYLSDGLLVLNQ